MVYLHCEFINAAVHRLSLEKLHGQKYLEMFFDSVLLCGIIAHHTISFRSSQALMMNFIYDLILTISDCHF